MLLKNKCNAKYIHLGGNGDCIIVLFFYYLMLKSIMDNNCCYNAAGGGGKISIIQYRINKNLIF